MKTAHVCIVASRTRTIYIGVTGDLHHRAWEHKTGFKPESFTAQYKLRTLVFYAEFARYDVAIAFEKYVKGKCRAWRMELVEGRNPRWDGRASDRSPEEGMCPRGETGAPR